MSVLELEIILIQPWIIIGLKSRPRGGVLVSSGLRYITLLREYSG